MLTRILEKFSSMPVGTIFFGTDLTADGSIDTDAARSALQDAVRDGWILRIARGIYCKPRRTPAGVALQPDLDCIIGAMVRHHGIDAIPMGLSAAWKLGLISDRPDPYQLASSRGQHTVRFHGAEIQFLPGRSMPFQYKTELAAMLLTALPAIGEEQLTQEHAAKIKQLILHCPDRDAFREDVTRLPLWMKNYLRRL